MSDPPLVSVVVPCYNHDKYVTQAIESIIDQTYRNIEIFVVDDGSSDHSVEILKALSLKHQFYFESQKNTGVIGTLNKLFSMCKGKYIAILASDDFWKPEKIEKQVAFMEASENVGACFCNGYKINSNGEMLDETQQIITGYREYVFDDILLNNFAVVPPTVMFRKSVLDTIGYYDEKYKLDDWYMWLKLTHHQYKLVVLPDILGFYRIHGANLSQNVYRMYEWTMKVFEIYRQHPLYKEAIKERRLHYFPYLALLHKKEALDIIRKVVAFDLSFSQALFYYRFPSRFLNSFLILSGEANFSKPMTISLAKYKEKSALSQS